MLAIAVSRVFSSIVTMVINEDGIPIVPPSCVRRCQATTGTGHPFGTLVGTDPGTTSGCESDAKLLEMAAGSRLLDRPAELFVASVGEVLGTKTGAMASFNSSCVGFEPRFTTAPSNPGEKLSEPDTRKLIGVEEKTHGEPCERMRHLGQDTGLGVQTMEQEFGDFGRGPLLNDPEFV